MAEQLSTQMLVVAMEGASGVRDQLKSAVDVITWEKEELKKLQ